MTAQTTKAARSVMPMSPVSPRYIRSAEDYDSDDEHHFKAGHGRHGSDTPLLSDIYEGKIEIVQEGELTGPFKTFLDNNAGLLLIAGAQVWFAIMAAGVAYLSQLPEASVSTSELIAVRMIITGICCHTWLRFSRDLHPLFGPPEVRLLLVVRGFFGFFGLFGQYFSLRYLPLSDAIVLTFIAPFLTGIVAAIFLSEGYRVGEAMAGIVSLAGVILIAKPTALFGQHQGKPILIDGRQVTDRERMIAVGVAILGCVGAAGAYTTMRLIGKRASPLHSVQFFSVSSTALACLGPLLLPKTQFWFIPKDNMFVFLLIVIGIAGFTGQVLLAAGLARERAGRGIMASYLQMPLAMITEKLVFDRHMDLLSFLGASIIMTAALYTLLTKPKDETPSVASTVETPVVVHMGPDAASSRP